MLKKMLVLELLINMPNKNEIESKNKAAELIREDKKKKFRCR